MFQFTSKREKRLWYWVAITTIGIYSLIFIGRPLSGYLRERELLANAFWVAIWLTLATVLWHGWKQKIGRLEIGVWMGVAAVYLLVILRMAVPEERSHLIEYSVLAVFIHEALKERVSNGGAVWRPALLAIFITTAIGLFDEFIQLFVPERVFDPVDMIFNTGAAIMAILASTVISWSRKKISNMMG